MTSLYHWYSVISLHKSLQILTMLIIYAIVVDLFAPSIFMNKIKYSRWWLCGAIRSTYINNLSLQKAWKHKEGLVNEYSIEGFKANPLKEYTRLKSFKKGYVICHLSHKNTFFSIKIQFLKLDYNHLFISCKLFNFF